MPSLQRGREHERLERGSRLALALDREVELTRVEVAAAVHREHRPGRRVHRNECSLRSVGARQPLVDSVAGKLLQPQIDGRVHAITAAEHVLRAELRLVEQLRLHVLAEVRRLAHHAGQVHVLRLRHRRPSGTLVFAGRDVVLLQHQPQHDRSPALRRLRVRDRVVQARVLGDAGEKCCLRERQLRPRCARSTCARRARPRRRRSRSRWC